MMKVQTRMSDKLSTLLYDELGG